MRVDGRGLPGQSLSQPPGRAVQSRAQTTPAKRAHSNHCQYSISKGSALPWHAPFQRRTCLLRWRPGPGHTLGPCRPACPPCAWCAWSCPVQGRGRGAGAGPAPGPPAWPSSLCPAAHWHWGGQGCGRVTLHTSTPSPLHIPVCHRRGSPVVQVLQGRTQVLSHQQPGAGRQALARPHMPVQGPVGHVGVEETGAWPVPAVPQQWQEARVGEPVCMCVGRAYDGNRTQDQIQSNVQSKSRSYFQSSQMLSLKLMSKR